MRPKRRLLAASGSLILILLVGLAAARWERTIQWRVEVLSWKLTGELPDVGWRELGYVIAPSRLRARLYSTSDWGVTERSRGEDPCPVLWDTPLGHFWGRADDDENLIKVLQSRLQYVVFLRGLLAIGPEDVVLDGGSHLGTFTRFALQKGARRVVAFEPDSTNNICFKRTFRQEIVEGRVILVEAALWHEPGVLEFAESPSGLSGSVSHVSPDTRGLRQMKQVPGTTIDDSFQRLQLDHVSFIKLHIEGAERQALLGARQTIARFHPRLMLSTHHHADRLVNIPEDIARLSSSYRISRSASNVYGY